MWMCVSDSARRRRVVGSVWWTTVAVMCGNDSTISFSHAERRIDSGASTSTFLIRPSRIR